MAVSTLRLGQADIQDILESTLGYDSGSITVGRRAPSVRKSPHAHIRWVPGEGPVWYAGAYTREYVYRVEIYRRTADSQSEATVDDAVQADAEQLRDTIARNGPTALASTPAVDDVTAEVVDRDLSIEATREEQIAVVEVRISVFEIP